MSIIIGAWFLMALVSTTVIVTAWNPSVGWIGVWRTALVFLVLVICWPILVFGALSEWAEEN